MSFNAFDSRRGIQFIILVFSLSIFAGLTSCAVPPDEMEMLDRATRGYERAFRWGDFSKAKTYHKNEPGLADLERRRLALYRVTAYDLLRVDTPDLFNSYVVVEIKYYKIERPSIKTITVKQHWKRDKGTNYWYLNSKFPRLK